MRSKAALVSGPPSGPADFRAARKQNRAGVSPCPVEVSREPAVRYFRSAIFTFISSEFALSSGAYIASPLVGRALNSPGISARSR